MKLLSEFREYKERFRDICKDISYQRRGSTNIEGFFIYGAICTYEPYYFIESGVCNGRSTEVIAETQVGEHIAIDQHILKSTKERLKGYDIIWVEQDAETVEIPDDGSIVAFIDGPKHGRGLWRLVKNIMAKDWKMIIIHDCYKGSQTRKEFRNFCKDRKGIEWKVLGYEDTKDLFDLNKGYEEFLNSVKKRKRDIKARMIKMGSIGIVRKM